VITKARLAAPKRTPFDILKLSGDDMRSRRFRFEDKNRDAVENALRNRIVGSQGSEAADHVQHMWSEHWPLARVGLRRLGLLALADPKGERLVIRRADQARIADPAEDPNAIVAIDITVPNRIKLDPTGREAMTHQFSVASPAVDDRVVVLDAYKTTKS
jgi:hypothetical protein